MFGKLTKRQLWVPFCALLMLILATLACGGGESSTEVEQVASSTPNRRWRIEIVEVQRHESVPWQEELLYPEGDSWLVIFLDIENLSSKEETLRSDDFKLIVDLQTVEVNTDATGGAGTEAGIENTVAGWLGLDFEAGAKKRQVVVFDLPDDSADKIELRVKDYEFDLGAPDEIVYKADPTATSTPLPTNTPLPTQTPLPTHTLEPKEALWAEIRNVLGTSNRDIERVTNVGFLVTEDEIGLMWAINDNLTEDMVKDGAKLDIAEVLDVISKSDVDYRQVAFLGTFPLVDAYGNETEEIVVTAVYSRETVERANWEGIPLDNVYIIADKLEIHPAFQD